MAPTEAGGTEHQPVIPTVEEIEAARTPGGGHTRDQLAEWGVAWPPPKGWRKRLIAQAEAATNENAGDKP